MSFVAEMCVKCVIVQGGTHMQQRIEGKDTFSKAISKWHVIYIVFSLGFSVWLVECHFACIPLRQQHGEGAL